MSAIVGTSHEWTRGDSLQWGALGLSSSAAQTPYKCVKCGVRFVHAYHTQPDIYAAMESAGVPKDCIK